MTAAPPRSSVVVNGRVEGHDGVALATDIYLAEQQPSPVIVTRTPYGRGAHLAEGLGWSSRGISYVVQDVRGRYDSDGIWVPYEGERADGAALAGWIAGQPWCDGRLVAMGASYSAYTAWALAVSAPAQVSAVISQVPAMGFSSVKFDQSGILRLAEHVNWWLEHGDSRISRPHLLPAVYAAGYDVLRRLPVIDIHKHTSAHLPTWSRVVTDGPKRHAPEAIIDDELAAYTGATLHVGGWYDLLLPETIRQWRLAGRDHASRPMSSLLVGPWHHDLAAGAPHTTVGARDHGATSRLNLGDHHLRWIRQALEGTSNRHAKVFVLGANQWWTGAEWPPPVGSMLTLHAHAGGRLTAEPPRTTGHDEFPYDPDDPFPSCDPSTDRARVKPRVDAVRYHTAPMDDAVVLHGKPRVTLSATTDAPDADWVVRLLEESADGTCLALTQGVAVVDGELSGPHDIALAPVAVSVAAGSRLVLEITSSDFPYLARNLNTGGDRYTTTATTIAHQRVLTGPAPTGTSITLPLGDTL